MEAVLDKIEKYLDTHNLALNRYRVKIGDGQTQCFGIVYKRCGNYGQSRQNWLHVRLYELLLELGKYIETPWTSIQVNKNYTCAPHMDTGNLGLSTIIGCGDYDDGRLCLQSESGSIHKVCIKNRPYVFNGSQILHWTEPWTGNRYSIVFHSLDFRKGYVKNQKDYVIDGMLMRVNDERHAYFLDKAGKVVEYVDLESSDT